MALSLRQKLYLRSYFRKATNNELARVLDVKSALVKKYLEKRGLTRTEDEKQAIVEADEIDLPAFDGFTTPIPRAFPLGRRDLIAACAVFVSTMAVYLFTVAPGLTGEDSGELIAAACTLGIAHPPGYPIWCILGKVFATIIPFGTIAWRVNIMSAVFAALTCVNVYLIVTKLTYRRTAAIGAALCLAFSAALWSQAIIAEVYTLNTFFLSMCVYLLMLWNERREDKLLLLFAFIYGLSLTNHTTMWPLGILFAAYILSVDYFIWKRWKTIAAIVGLFAVSLLVFLYLLIRAKADPPMNWGNPSSWDRMTAHIGRDQYSFEFTKNPRSIGLFFAQLGSFFGYYFKQFTPVLGVCAMLGAVVQFFRSKRDWVFFGCLFGATTLGFIVLLNFEIERELVTAYRLFYIPAWVIASIWLGVFFGFITDLISGVEPDKYTKLPLRVIEKTSNWLAGRKAKLAVTTIAAVVFVGSTALPLLAHWHENDKHKYYWAYDHGLNIFNILEENAIIIPSGDHNSFPLIYFQAVEGMRRDVLIADKYGYIDQAALREIDHDLYLRYFRGIPSQADRRYIEYMIVTVSGRPVYFTTKRDMQDLPDYTLKPVGTLYRVYRKGEIADDWGPPDCFGTGLSRIVAKADGDDGPPADTEDSSEDNSKAEDANLMNTHPLHKYYYRNSIDSVWFDYTADVVKSEIEFSTGVYCLAVGFKEEGLKHFEEIEKYSYDIKEPFNNIGSALAEHGMLVEAEKYLAKAIEIDGKYPTALRNIGFVSYRLNLPGQTIDCFERWLAVTGANDYTARMILGDSYRAMGDNFRAEEHYRKASEAAPNSPMPWKALGYLYLDTGPDAGIAASFFEKSLAIAPEQEDIKDILTRIESGEFARAPGFQDPFRDLGIPMPGRPRYPGMDFPGFSPTNTGRFQHPNVPDPRPRLPHED